MANLIEVGAPKVQGLQSCVYNHPNKKHINAFKILGAYKIIDRCTIKQVTHWNDLTTQTLKILVAIVLLMKWSKNMAVEENKFDFFDIFSGKSNCTREWFCPQLQYISQESVKKKLMVLLITNLGKNMAIRWLLLTRRSTPAWIFLNLQGFCFPPAPV